MKKLTLILIALFALVGFAAGQTALTQTTLSSAVNGPAGYSGSTMTRIDTNIFLASTTGISAPTLGGSPVSVIYVGGEAMGVFGVNTSLNFVTVFRGFLGTNASPHPSGDMVLISNVYSTTLATGGNPIPSGFFDKDPPRNGSCTAAGTPTTPWVNILTGDQWLCSTVTNTWVPGFNNRLVPISMAPTAAVASVAGSTLPSGPLFHVTGTNAITGWTQPIGCNATAVGSCSFTIIPDAVCTWTSAGNIALAGSCVVNKALTFVWDAKNSKWVPSYIA